MGLDFEKPCTHTLSANEIRVASECARKRYYSSRDCLAIRANTPRNALLLGSAFHQTLQYYYTELDKKIKELGLAIPTVEDCQDLMDQITVPDIDTSLLQASDLATYRCIIDMYKEQIPYDLVQYEVISCEQAFYMKNWPIDDVMYHGNIDMIVRDRNTGLFYFFEHKTCASFRPEIYSRFDIQLHIYDAYGVQEYKDMFGGMILNQVKKAKTEKGYDQTRQIYTYNNVERKDFLLWLKAKTIAIVSPDNHHAPCNNYMSCKMCEYQNICLKYGYVVPATTKEITENKDFVGEDGNTLFTYDPRVEEGGED